MFARHQIALPSSRFFEETPLKKVFISYRRQDSGTAARRIAAEFGAKYGEQNIFIDTDSIRVGANWARAIDKALAEAAVVLVVIGPKWIYTHDEYGRRRIDNDLDWVRNEVLHALDEKKTVIPLLVEGAQPLEAVALPETLMRLCQVQNYSISENFWDRDLGFLFADLDRSGYLPNNIGDSIVYPAKRDKSVPLSDEEALSSIDASAGWSISKSRRAFQGSTKYVSELTKTYEFQTFEDCVHFISTAARHISFIDHHPRWENIWISLIVSLTSWDIEGALTYKDIRLAKYLDELFIAYKKQSEA
jgi:pterin-4a-carbinolamine dehydratase